MLTGPRIAGIEPHVRRYAEELVDGFGPTGAFDASTQFGQLIPTITMCSLLDLPTTEREQFLAWNLDTLGGNDFASPAAQKAWAEMGEYWVDIVRDRRDHPSTDLISQILHAQSGGDVEISDAEVSAFCGLLHDASQNTTMNMITLAVVSLANAPDQRRRLAGHPEIWPQAIEELLRFVSPVQGLARCTTRDVTLHGVTIPEGDQVLLLFGSANHDDAVFDRPDVLDVDRPAGRHHWTFGHGIHHCLGNAVAKLETRVGGAGPARTAGRLGPRRGDRTHTARAHQGRRPRPHRVRPGGLTPTIDAVKRADGEDDDDDGEVERVSDRHRRDVPPRRPRRP